LLENIEVKGNFLRKSSPKQPERKSLKLESEPKTKKKSKDSPKTPKASSSSKKKTSAKTESPKVVKTESPENKPQNGQSKETEPAAEEETKKDDGKILKIQSAGAGQAGASYNPSKKNYHPIDDAFWKHGEK
jgi:DNA ligase 1